jgi:predicted TIM-barrel fold metal-dependent hydrolase
VSLVASARVTLVSSYSGKQPWGSISVTGNEIPLLIRSLFYRRMACGGISKPATEIGSLRIWSCTDCLSKNLTLRPGVPGPYVDDRYPWKVRTCSGWLCRRQTVQYSEAMLTRRSVLFGAAVLALLRRGFAKASQPATPVGFAVPPHACDCHTHIYGDPEKFPLWPGRSYTPEPALPREMSRLHRALHMERVVIVTPSTYGTDNSVTLYGMKARGSTARGIIVINEETPESDLDKMDHLGVRGIRLDMRSLFPSDPAGGRRLFQNSVPRLQRRAWHVQVIGNLSAVAGIKDLVQDSPVPVVFDHFGFAQAALGLDQPGFSDLVELVRGGRAYVKISAVYRCSAMPSDYSDMIPFAKALITANPDRILWGSDWPHPAAATPAGRKITDITPHLQVDDGRILNLLPVWAPDPDIRTKILVDNPGRLYRF